MAMMIKKLYRVKALLTLTAERPRVASHVVISPLTLDNDPSIT